MTAKKRALGRGLDALLRVEEGGPRALPLSRLKPNRLQPRSRFEEAGLEELAESIRVQGIVQPLVVAARSDGDYTIVAGERRWRAARLAGLAEVPVVVREIEDDRQLLETALVENLQRSDLDPMEEAEAYRVLQETFGLKQQEVAARVGKARTTVTNALRLLKLPRQVQDLLREGRLTAGQARPLLAIAEPERQIRLARRAADEGMSARELEARASGKRSAAGRKAAARPAVDPDTAAAADKLTRRLQTRVEIRRRGRGGQLRISFGSEEELMRIYEMLMRAGGKR